jgi:hypothetical protein
MAYMASGDYATAEKVLFAAIQADPNDEIASPPWPNTIVSVVLSLCARTRPARRRALCQRLDQY